MLLGSSLRSHTVLRSFRDWRVLRARWTYSSTVVYLASTLLILKNRTFWVPVAYCISRLLQDADPCYGVALAFNVAGDGVHNWPLHDRIEYSNSTDLYGTHGTSSSSSCKISMLWLLTRLLGCQCNSTTCWCHKVNITVSENNPKVT